MAIFSLGNVNFSLRGVLQTHDKNPIVIAHDMTLSTKTLQRPNSIRRADVKIRFSIIHCAALYLAKDTLNSTKGYCSLLLPSNVARPRKNNVRCCWHVIINSKHLSRVVAGKSDAKKAKISLRFNSLDIY